MNNEIIDDLVNWIKNYVESSHSKGVVIGISGGKDSMVVAKLCTLALKKENVYGVIMPNGTMKDIIDAKRTCKLLGINYSIINIKNVYKPLLENVKIVTKNISDITTINTAPRTRIRMTMLYAIAGSLGYLVANTSNLSEAMVGYTTKWGDNVGDFYPLLDFTKTEVCEIGKLLGLPVDLVEKNPSDGLSGKNDEEKLGFTYNELDNFIRNGVKSDKFDLILSKHCFSKHKRNAIIKYTTNLKNYFDNLEQCGEKYVK